MVTILMLSNLHSIYTWKATSGKGACMHVETIKKPTGFMVGPGIKPGIPAMYSSQEPLLPLSYFG